MIRKNVKTLVPENVLEEIIQVGKEYFTDGETGDYYDDIDDIDKEIQDYVDSEIKSYIKIMKIDFKNFYISKEKFIKEYEGLDPCDYDEYKIWGNIYKEIEGCLEDFKLFDEYIDGSIESEVVVGFKKDILEYGDCGYLYEELMDRISEYKRVIEIRENISPYKNLLIELEEIVGSECYNKNIQNYSSWGEFTGEGRGFRYPVTLVVNSQLEKLKEIPASIPGEELISGYYSFGANELNIYRALFKVIKYLEEKYGVELERS